MPADMAADITYSCAELGMHGDRCSRPLTCNCTCHRKEKTA